MTTTQSDLIQRLLELSRSNQIDWQRIGDYTFAYEIDDTRFLLEKFVSRLDDALITCFRLKLFHPFDRLAHEWVGRSNDQSTDTFILLGHLHHAIAF